MRTYTRTYNRIHAIIIINIIIINIIIININIIIINIIIITIILIIIIFFFFKLIRILIFNLIIAHRCTRLTRPGSHDTPSLPTCTHLVIAHAALTSKHTNHTGMTRADAKGAPRAPRIGKPITQSTGSARP